MISTSLNLVGELSIKLIDVSGNVTYEKRCKNLVVQGGKELVAERLTSNTPSILSHMAIGTDTTPTALDQSTLVTEVARAALDTTSQIINTVTYSASFGAGVGTGTITEAGLFDAEIGGRMFSRVNDLLVYKTATDTLAISWTITVN